MPGSEIITCRSRRSSSSWPTSSLRKGAQVHHLRGHGPDHRPLCRLQRGLGWYGLNRSLFVPGRGSWVVLGEILTDIELEPDPRRLPAHGVPPLHQGLSHRGPHPSGLDYNRRLPSDPNEGDDPRAALIDGQRPGGCDRCQEACPHNQGAPTAAGDILPGAPYPNLVEVLTMDKEAWAAGLGRSAIGWRG